MIVLGIADNHDSGAAVMIHNGLVSAVNQERIDRVKSSAAFPWGAIDAALDAADVSAREVDRIVIGTSFTPSAPLRLFPERHEKAREGGQFSPLLHTYVAYQSALRATGLHTFDVDLSRQILKRRLKARRFTTDQLELVDHHRAHAQAAYRTQGHPDALVFTVDAMGDGTTVTVSRGHNGQLDTLYRESGFSAINAFYGRITELLGFVANRHEGKVMGLAARATPPDELLAHLRSKLRFVGPGFSRASMFRAERREDPFWRAVERFDREQIAAAAQQVLEESVLGFVRHWIQQTDCHALAVAGGIFANVKLNQRIAALPEVERIFVFPGMSDTGNSVGAALMMQDLLEPGFLARGQHRLRDVYWGPQATDEEIEEELKLQNLPYEKLSEEQIIERAAQAIAKGDVVGWFQGRMEFGPRALGNRSMVGRPTDADINKTLNDRLERTEFMPFAPSALVEYADELFVGVDKAAHPAEFMTVTFDVKPEWHARIPAVVHVDGTARPQLVRQDTNPRYWKLIERYRQLSGIPVVLNTSFNVHEEPIVCGPEEGIRALAEDRIDRLAIGNYWVQGTRP